MTPAGGGLRTREVGDGTSFHTQTDWIVAVLILGAAVAAFAYPVLKYDDPWVFDPYDPEFSPAIFVPVFLFAYGAKHLVTAIRGTLLRRRFGESVAHFDNTAVQPGEALKGVIRSPVHFVPTGDYEIRLQCVQKTTSLAGNPQDTIREEQTIQVSPQFADPRKGIPFAFMIPRGALSTTGPGAGAIDMIGEAAGEVRWILEVKAPLKGLNYYAIFGVHVVPVSASAS